LNPNETKKKTLTRPSPAVKSIPDPSTNPIRSYTNIPIRPSSKSTNQFPIEKFSSKPDDRVECRKCKRKFNPDRINKHQSVCIGPINEIPAKPVMKIVKKKKAGIPLWKKQHLDFINNIRYAKKMKFVQEAGGDIRKIQPPTQYFDPTSDYKQCPYCLRRYSEQVAERHIPNCKNIINKPRPPPKPVGTKIQSKSLIPDQKKIGAGPGYCPKCGGKSLPNARVCTFCGRGKGK
jgi:zinc-finger of a C2HC-type